MLAHGVGADLAEANRRFESGDFYGAAKIYQDLAGSGEASTALLYNLGNSQYRMGEHGPAILSYERAKLLSPRDPDLRANLALARKSAAVFEVPRIGPNVDAVLTYLSRHEWSWLVASAALWLGIIAVAWGAGRIGHPVVRKCAGASVVLAVILNALGTTVLILRRDEGDRGIVLSKDAGVLLSPFEKAESLGTPGAGRIVMMGEKSGDYHFVSVPGTTLEGWMRDGEVAWIAP